MNFFMIAYWWMFLGFLTSMYMAFYYRINESTRTPPKTEPGIEVIQALIGQFIWPVQWIIHLVGRRK